MAMKYVKKGLLGLMLERDLTFDDLTVLVEHIGGWVETFKGTRDSEIYLDANPRFKKVCDKL